MFETGVKPGQDKFDHLKEVLGWLETFVADGKFSAGTDWITLGDLALLATYSTVKVEREVQFKYPVGFLKAGEVIY